MFNKELLKQNKKFILISLGLIFITIFITLLLSNNSSYKIEELQESGETSVSGLVINEVMSSNSGAYSDESGNTYDWIELYNGSKKDINLKNYGLSDNESIKWVFPEVVIKKGEYLVINCSGTNQEGLYANFKLSIGEKVFIKNANGKVKDAVEIVNLNKNESMIRNLEGSWVITDTPTPGYVNTLEGYNEYHNSLLELNNSIKINEVLPDNNGNFINDHNEYLGYVEIINTSNDTINLKNYSLSNNSKTPFKWQFPEISIKPNQILVIYMDSKYEELTTTFKLENKNGDVVLTNNKGKIIDEVSYETLPNGYALRKTGDEFYQTNVLSPGYSNDSNGENKFAQTHLKNKDDLIINEVMNNNYSYLPQNGSKYYDWIELKNNSNKTINLSDYSISTDYEKESAIILPDVDLKQGETYILMASGDSNLTNTYTHINFKISDNESIYLYKKDKIIDSIYVANIPIGYSMGRNKSNGFYYFSTPTPLKENTDGKVEVSIAPSFTTKAGIYNDVDSVKVEIEGPSTIYYTTDGSTPTDSSKKYTKPLEITKTTVIKAIVYEDDLIKSKVITNSYIINENHTLPVMSISLDSSKLNSLYSNEAETYAELYEDGKSFSVPCGIKLFGGSARSYSKKSFALKFKKKYGMSSLNYKVFDDRNFSSFETLVLRTGTQDMTKSIFRDVLMTSLVDEYTNVDTQANKTIILYINGKYWGIYDIREKVESEFVANHYNVLEDNTDIIRIDRNVTSGNLNSYNELINYITNHDLKNQEYYEYIKTKIDIENFCDYWASETYTANNDIINQRFFSNANVDNGKWKWIFYDLDYGMYNTNINYYQESVSLDGISSFKINTFLMRNLMRNAEFQKTYVERIAYNLKNTWSTENVIKKTDELYQLYLPEIKREVERWNFSLETWEQEVEKLRTYAKKRPGVMVRQAKSFFNLSNDEMKEYFGDLG